ncbi:MAG: hypothetical protein ACRCZF_24200, partial [Gemmataceae bacterium]
HSWAGGAYYMEVWGYAALEVGDAEEAEEAFQEALAHDSGSIRAALGLQALCERLGRTDEAARYAKLVGRLSQRADRSLVKLWRAEAAAKAKNLVTATTSISTQAPEKPAPVAPAAMKLAPYSFLVANGPERGQATCFVCEQGKKPGAIVFFREPSAEVAKLLAAFDAEFMKTPAIGARVWATQLTKTADLDALAKWHQTHGLKTVPVGAFEDADGPPAYKLGADVEVTILRFAEKKITQTTHTSSADLTTERIAELVRTAR